MRRAFVVLFLAACTGGVVTAATSPDGGAPAADAGTMDGGTLGAEAGCAMPNVGTAAELAATPRANRDLELLALSLETNQLTASQATYDRVVRDVTAIRAAHPTLGPTTGGYGTQVADPTIFNVDYGEGGSTDRGGIPNWDCLNAFYGLTPQQTFKSESGSSWQLSAHGVLQTKLLFPLYQGLPVVTNVTASSIPDLTYGEHVPAQICARKQSATWDYEFDTGGDFFGPPPATPRVVSWFSTDTSGAIVTSGTWSSDQDSGLPPWFCLTK